MWRHAHRRLEGPSVLTRSLWPSRNNCARAQVLFMNELEEILELLGEEQLEELKGELFLLLSNCVASQHFQVVERTLFLWNNETLCSQGCLSRQYTPTLLPMIYGDL